MASGSDRLIRIELSVQANSALLEGLEVWQDLGLLSEEQVKQIGDRYLTCALPEPIPVTDASVRDAEPDSDFLIEPVERSSRRPRIRTGARSSPVRSDSAASSTSVGGTTIRQSNFLAERLQSLMAEISVIWLLFLGVFMVVVSSGVLAASQWRNFPPTGQYCILFAYTLAFWVAGLWATKQPNLQLTARMLQTATLLIIPVNFWMMDGFKLWQQPGGGAIAVIAAFGLTALLLQLLGFRRNSVHPVATSRWLLLDAVALSWLHWGWGWSGFPLIATYLGTLGTAFVLLQQDQASAAITAQTSSEARSPDLETVSSSMTGQTWLAPSIIAVAASALLLIARAVLVAQVPIHRLGLAVGICGWLLCWLARQNPGRVLWTQAGAALLLLGWLVTVSVQPPWQAIAISGLALWLLSDRLRRLPQAALLTAAFLVGLQGYWLLWWLIPVEGRQAFLSWNEQIAGSSFTAASLVGIGFFPYLALTLVAAQYWRQRQQPQLADWSEALALGLGIALTLFSLTNPLLRSLNLAFSTLTLAVVVRQRPQASSGLIYLTHVTGLTAIASVIDLGFPNLSTQLWAGVLLAGALLEWSFTLVPRWPVWKRSAWYFGLLLAAISYTLFGSLWLSESSAVGRFWLLAPAAMTGLATRRQWAHIRQASWLSTFALVVVQPLTLGFATPRLIGLGVATSLMLVNTYRLQHLGAAILTVGFSLGLAIAVIWQGFSTQLTLPSALNLVAIATLILWLVHDIGRRQTQTLAKIYAQASNGWAIALSITNLLILTGYDLALYGRFGDRSVGYTVAIALTTLAIGYRIWQQASNVGFYGLAWGIELLVVRLLWSPDVSLVPTLLERLAIANLALGLIAQLASDWWVRRTQQPYLISWHVIPVVYAALALMGAHTTFTATTGLYSFGAALIGIGVGRQQPRLALTYLSLVGVSIAAYELLIYQLMQATGGNAGDGILLLGALAAVIAIGERLLSRWLVPYLRLDAPRIHAIAHLHWIISSGLMLLALFNSLSSTGELLWVGITAVLAVYALREGRNSESWTYTGIVASLLAIGYLLSLWLSDATLIAWGAAIASAIAYGMYVLPWQRGGWALEPWQQSAILLPGVIAVANAGGVNLQSLLIVAAFYAWVAKTRNQARLSYLSILLADWAILRFFSDRALEEPLWYAAVLGGSLLYVAQVDPALRSPTEREKRHWLRSLAVGLICLTAIYQSETSLAIALGTLGFSIGLILAGLTLQVRAFLYVGTASFMIQVLRQVWLLIDNYSLLLWALLIVLGLALIWIAATFEARRSQVSALLQHWVTALNEWQ
ncbi:MULTISPECIES: DUF2157 domain-containing protein [Trichocoleus]|uniref:DUF2157 domain-containing protein n=1 Tax=Trichocoleus desertorum GB2-A4 TaxID=2933944 RepID=A0ABV0JAE0_9CYAN|nr:DUF2157 domain-containing protein [Trichocoleus sp. FACHB-46]MBD1861457.1 DUF2157 domain-containing protein [Trichocoleus sp. FACHB-46]